MTKFTDIGIYKDFGPILTSLNFMDDNGIIHPWIIRKRKDTYNYEKFTKEQEEIYRLFYIFELANKTLEDLFTNPDPQCVCSICVKYTNEPFYDGWKDTSIKLLAFVHQMLEILDRRTSCDRKITLTMIKLITGNDYKIRCCQKSYDYIQGNGRYFKVKDQYKLETSKVSEVSEVPEVSEVL